MPNPCKLSSDNNVLPRRLMQGDHVAVVSPSSEIASFPRRLDRGIEELSRLGLVPKLAMNALAALGHVAGTPEERASDIMEAFLNPSIKALFTSSGGWNVNSVLPLLDYKLISENPKPIIGFSDITALLLGVLAQSKQVVFHGPTVLPTMGEAEGMFPFSRDNMKRALWGEEILGDLPEPTMCTEEFLWWEKEDSRPRKLVECSQRRCIRPGEGEGTILGGNLDTIVGIAGSHFWPEYNNTLLFLEEESGNTGKVERDLQTLQSRGIFDTVKGLIFARPYRFETLSQNRPLFSILLDIGERYNIPVLADVSVGHTNPVLTVPMGVKCYLNAQESVFRIIEQCTCRNGV